LLGEADGCLGGRHLVPWLLDHLFGKTRETVVPMLGDLDI
jgi:hypothetical protein